MALHKTRRRKASVRRTARTADVNQEIKAICDAFTALGRALEGLKPAAAATVRARAKAPKARARKRQMTPQRLAALRTQGEYIGQLRNLKPRQKGQVKALREAKGVRAAIALAKKLSRG